MSHELTKDGLFSYFDPVAIEKIIEFSLVRRHLSVHQYILCKEACFLSRTSQNYAYKKTVDINQAIIKFESLQKATTDEIKQYFRVEKVRQIYADHYGDLFDKFESKLFALDEVDLLNYWDFLSFFDRGSEKKLILQIQSAMSLPLQDFTNTVLEQDALLKEISLDLVCQARKAQLFIAAVQNDDMKFKQSVMKIGFSVVKLGLSFFHAEELVDLSQALADLAADTADKVNEQFDSVVSNIEEMLVQTHIQSIQNAELKLLTTLSRDMAEGLLTVVEPKQIEIYWQKYRLFIFYNCIESMRGVLQKYVYCDDFFRCIIKQTAYQHKKLTQDELMVHATEKARTTVTNIFSALDDQIKNIRHIRDAVASSHGAKIIEDYFRKVCLIQYTLKHENTGSFLRGWITKKLGHRLSFYFPDLVFQKKWSSANLHNMLYHNVKYCKKEMTLAEYKERRRNSSVVLGLIRNSSRVKQSLFANLEDVMPSLSDQVIMELQNIPTVLIDDLVPEEPYHSVRAARYSFSRGRLSLFSFSEPNPDDVAMKSIPKRESSVVLVSKRPYFPEGQSALEF